MKKTSRSFLAVTFCDTDGIRPDQSGVGAGVAGKSGPTNAPRGAVAQSLSNGLTNPWPKVPIERWTSFRHDRGRCLLVAITAEQAIVVKKGNRFTSANDTAQAPDKPASA
jgi:hypothetical protein